MRLLRAILAGAALAAGPASAETLVVGVENLDYYPHYTFDGGEYGGFGGAILKEFATAEGLTFTFRSLPVARLFQTFVDGGVDFKYPDNEKWAADLKSGVTVVYSAPVTPYIDGVSVRPVDFGQPAESYDKLGIVAGFTAWDWLDRIQSGAVRLEENASLDALLRQAMAGRIRAVYANVAVVNGRLQQMGESDQLKFDDGLPHTKSNYHLASIKRPDVIAKFDAWMAANADRVEALRAEYKVGEAFLR